MALGNSLNFYYLSRVTSRGGSTLGQADRILRVGGVGRRSQRTDLWGVIVHSLKIDLGHVGRGHTLTGIVLIENRAEFRMKGRQEGCSALLPVSLSWGEIGLAD